MQRTVAIGEIWKVRLNDAQGHEQLGERPAIVVAEVCSIGIATVIPCTSQDTAARFPFTCKIRASAQNGLPRDSVALVFQQRCLNSDSNRFVNRYGTIEKELLERLRILLRDYLKLGPQSGSISPAPPGTG